MAACGHRVGRWTALNPLVAFGFKRQGDALDNAGHSREAIAAYTKAIGLETNPKFLGADHLDRAAAFGNLDEWPKSIVDYTEAIRLAPSAAAFRRRGAASVVSGSGKLSDAVADLRKANEMDPKDGYVVLWLAIAEAKLGHLDVDELKGLAKALDPKWPRDIVRVLLNEPTSEQPQGSEVLNELDTKGRKCELDFYVGALRLAQGDREEGIRRLQAAIASGVKEYIEYQAAMVELKRLGVAVSASAN
jgi:lipoprotein NlpI